MAGEVIPFGKYKGQPIEVAIQDRQYVEWLTAQSWFRERFANLYTLVINNFQEPTETPEHNALQAKFLDEGFCRAFLQRLGKNLPLDEESIGISFEEWGFDVQMWGCAIEIKPKIGDDYPAILRQIKNTMQFQIRHNLLVEKPNQYRMPVLFLEEYTGIGASCEQFIDIFEKSGIRVVFLDDVVDTQSRKE